MENPLQTAQTVSPPEQVSPLSPETSLPSESSNHKMPFFILVVFIFFFLIGLGFYLSFGQKREKAEEIPIPLPVETTIVPTHKLSIATNWSTFSSSFGYTLKYPTDWALYTATSSQDLNRQHYAFENNDEAVIQFIEPNQPSHQGKPYGISIILKKPIDNPENLTIAEWLKKSFPALSLFRQEEITVDNLKAVAVTPLGARVSYIFIPYQSKIYQIINYAVTVKEYPADNYYNIYDYKTVFTQILSTFEFETERSR